MKIRGGESGGGAPLRGRRLPVSWLKSDTKSLLKKYAEKIVPVIVDFEVPRDCILNVGKLKL